MSTVSATGQLNEGPRTPREVEVPAPTAWPFLLALGATLMFAGLVTSASVSMLGAGFALAGCVGWFRAVLPEQQEEAVPVVPEDLQLTTDRRFVERIPVLEEEHMRAWLPVRTYPISAGFKGGIAGSVAMAVVACAYGLLKVGSIWYPINLLAAAVYAQSLTLSGQLNSFHATSFAIACGLHLLVSGLVGLLYGAMLPMFPRRPILLGGLVAPALWSGLIYTILGLVNPLLATHIDWVWFIASQVAFGIVAGLVVVRQASIPTRENVSFVLRAGIEAPGYMPTREGGEERR